jgi:DNA segregation ATPase FtsK/SpoIIIE, S-DNA-T family
MEHEVCAACGFDGGTYDDAALLDALRALGPSWGDLIAGAGSELRIRPAPQVWSAIEYAAHSRDVTALHVFGVEQALTLDEPTIPALAGGLVEEAAATYGDAEPDAVVAALGFHSSRLASVAEEAGTDSWSRGFTIGDDRIEVRRLLEHALHDSRHHLLDVERGLAQLRSSGA